MFKVSAPIGAHSAFIERIASNVAGISLEVRPSPSGVYDDPERPGHFIWEMQPKGGQNG